jgi:predicted Co/Zn/Cd cation transporter (cation efflux family)
VTERGALVLSAAAALAIGAVALGAALLSGSRAILLDALYNLAYFVTALFTLQVARLLARPDDARYPYGYLQFEPLINTVKGLLILGVSVYALVGAAITILSGGQSLALGPALGYAAAATVACAAIWVALRRANARIASPLVEADVGNWAVNTAVSAGVLAAFLGALVLERSGHRSAARFVDPVLVGTVVLLTLPVPVRMAARGLLALLNRAPPSAVTGAIEATVRAALAELPTQAIYVRTVKPGRTAYVTVHALVEPALATLDLAAADRLRRAVTEALVASHPPVIVDVVFTTIAEYAEPTAGFGRARGAGAPDASS